MSYYQGKGQNRLFILKMEKPGLEQLFHNINQKNSRGQLLRKPFHMNFTKILRQSIKKFDFFQTFQFLRYKAESQYRTVFGGIVSLIIFTVLMTMFYYKFVSCIEKHEVNSTVFTIIKQVPTSYVMQTYPKTPFMFAVKVHNFSKIDRNKYFEIQFKSMNQIWDYDLLKWNKSQVQIPLQQCTRQHWKFLPRMEKQYESWEFDEYLCLQMNSSLQVQGDDKSDQSKILSLKVLPCKNSSQSSNVCASQDQVDKIFHDYELLNSWIYMSNININPSTKQYIQYTFNYKNLLIFSKQVGSTGIISVQDFEIQTDQSIFPISNKKVQKGMVLSSNIIPRTYSRIKQDSPYCQFLFTKSDVLKTYRRSFDKLDQILAFVGGLFGMISMSLVIVNCYNNIAYQISLGSFLFKPQSQHQRLLFKKFNFIYYIIQIIYRVLQYLGFSPQWKQIIQFNKCTRQMDRQLDIHYILDRITYLETATLALLQEYQINELNFEQKLTLTQAKKKRKAFKMKKKFIQSKKRIQTIKMMKEVPNVEFNQTPSNYQDKTQIQLSKEQNSLCFNNKVYPRQSQSSRNSKNLTDSSSDDDEIRSESEKQMKYFIKFTQLKEKSVSVDQNNQKVWQYSESVTQNVLPSYIEKSDKFLGEQKGPEQPIRNTILMKQRFLKPQPLSIDKQRKDKLKKKVTIQVMRRQVNASKAAQNGIVFAHQENFYVS